MTYLRSEPFCDWLDVTCSPEASFFDSLVSFMVCCVYPVAFSEPDKGRVGYSVGAGILVLDKKSRFHRASASGGVIQRLKDDGYFRDYVNILGSVPHNVTRLDAAVDLYTDAPPYLRFLEGKYPDDRFSFGRKSLRVTRLYSKRESDGALTGTWYVGHRSSARVTARVYDKREEAMEKRRQVLPPTTRIELTFKKDYNCSLWDVLMPESLFYSHAAPCLLDVPEDKCIIPWAEKGLIPWKSAPVDTNLTINVFERRVTHSPELLELARLVSELGEEAKPIVMRRFETLFNSLVSSCGSGNLIEDV